MRWLMKVTVVRWKRNERLSLQQGIAVSEHPIASGDSKNVCHVVR